MTRGVAGVYLNDVDPAVTRRMGAAMGLLLRRQQPDGETPVVLLAGDGRTIMPELVAAACEGLRWTGCNVVDLGRATVGSMAFSVAHLPADGGLLLGNPSFRQQTVGLKFWQREARPLSAGGSLEKLEAILGVPKGGTPEGDSPVFSVGACSAGCVSWPKTGIVPCKRLPDLQNHMDRPTRRYGSLKRLQADAPYLAKLAEHYHALRPLRLVLDTPCRPLVGFLEQLTEPFACRITLHEAGPDRLPETVRDAEAHFSARVDGDGETCIVWDEQGRPVPWQRLLLLIAKHLVTQHPSRPIVLEEEASDVAEELSRVSNRVALSHTRRAEMHGAMRSGRPPALLGGGPSGRLWYTNDGHAAPDALVTLTWLLVILSQSDRPFSQVLDAPDEVS